MRSPPGDDLPLAVKLGDLRRVFLAHIDAAGPAHPHSIPTEPRPQGPTAQQFPLRTVLHQVSAVAVGHVDHVPWPDRHVRYLLQAYVTGPGIRAGDEGEVPGITAERAYVHRAYGTVGNPPPTCEVHEDRVSPCLELYARLPLPLAVEHLVGIGVEVRVSQVHPETSLARRSNLDDVAVRVHEGVGVRPPEDHCSCALGQQRLYRCPGGRQPQVSSEDSCSPRHEGQEQGPHEQQAGDHRVQGRRGPEQIAASPARAGGVGAAAPAAVRIPAGRRPVRPSPESPSRCPAPGS